jgi:hypothetical protein
MNTHVNNIQVRITYINRDGNHLVGLDLNNKTAIGLFVASARPDVVGKTIHIKKAKLKNQERCGSKFYGIYRISEICGPYEYDWDYAEADVESVSFEGDVPFVTIPLSRREHLKNAVDSVVIGSRWKSQNVIWVVRDTTLEKLAGRERVRVWIDTEDGRRGQAVYADSIAMKYKLVAA